MAVSYTHLFIVCPNNSGSTLLAELLGTSGNASIFPSLNHEGQWVAREAGDGIMPFPEGDERRNWTINSEKFSDPRNYDWTRLKEVWNDSWNPGKAVRVEKTPSLVVSAPLFQSRFESARFILSIRDPYAFCEGIRRREGYSVEVAARHWLKCAEFQLRNREVLDPHLYFSYEDLCDDPRGIANRIAGFIPELDDIDVTRVFDVMTCQSEIRNQNAAQISRLTAEDVRAIDNVLSQNVPVLEAFGYKLMSKTKPARAWPAWPAADSNTQRALSEVLFSGRWAISGPNTGTESYNRKFENAFARYHDVPYCVAVSNGSAAIQIALEALEVGWGDEVLVPGLTWVACASAVAATGAVPVLVDVDPATLCISPDAAAAAITENTAAILIVHAFCTAADIDAFIRLSGKTGIPVIEDCSQAHGAVYRGRRVGTFGRAGVFSMQQTKVLTSGEGGAVIVSDPALYDRLQQLRADGRRWTSTPRRGELDIEEAGDVQGRNFGLSEFQCAILIDRLTHLDEENRTRFENAKYLDGLLLQNGRLRPLDRPAGLEQPTYYQYCLRVDRSVVESRGIESAIESPVESIAAAVSKELALPVAPVYRPISKSPIYRPLLSKALQPGSYRDRFDPARFRLPVSQKAREQCLAFPQYALLGTTSDMEAIAEAFAKAVS